jgi:hypothetical protein
MLLVYNFLKFVLSDVCIRLFASYHGFSNCSRREIIRFSQFALGKSVDTMKVLSENLIAGRNTNHKLFHDRILSFCSLLYM